MRQVPGVIIDALPLSSTGSDLLASTQAALPISLIATPRTALLTCSPDENVSDVVSRFADFDHIPVTEDGRFESRILGLLDAHRYRGGKCAQKVTDVYFSLREEHLIGSDAPIIDFIREADERDCRLLVAGKSISGLVTLSDLQALPVRASLFALVTRLELVMTEGIKREFGGSDDWMERMSPGRREKLRDQIELAKKGEAFVEALLCTQFVDKFTVIAKSPKLPGDRKGFVRDLGAAQKLRDAIAHANEYASTRAKALDVCATVRTISMWIDRLSSFPAEEIA